jgi:hypothetical protein
MSKSRIIPFSALMTLAAIAALGAGKPAKTPTLPKEWRDYYDLSLYAAAPTIKELAAKTHPAIMTTHDEPFFVWIEPHKGAFAFTVGEANKLPSGEWCILSGDAPLCGFDHFPRTKITRAVERTSTLTPINHIAAPASHPTHGTLYQVAIARREGCLQGEMRLFMLHSPAGEWRYVGHAFGPGGDDGGWTAVEKTTFTWTDNPKAPIRIVTTYHLNPPEAYGGPSTVLSRFSDTTLSGPIPAKRVHSHDYLLPRRGDTFSKLMVRLAEEETHSESAAENRAARKRLETAVLKLNPGVTPDHLPADKPLYIPDYEDMCRLCRS